MSAKPEITPGRVRLAEGESTGHYHEAVGAGVGLLSKPGSEIVEFTAPDGCDVVHQEHHAVVLPPGDYRRSIVREYDHFAEESRAVVD